MYAYVAITQVYVHEYICMLRMRDIQNSLHIVITVKYVHKITYVLSQLLKVTVYALN